MWLVAQIEVHSFIHVTPVAEAHLSNASPCSGGMRSLLPLLLLLQVYPPSLPKGLPKAVDQQHSQPCVSL
jgi:hypothetical protein